MTTNEKPSFNTGIAAKYERQAKKFKLGASGTLIKAIWNGFGDSVNLHIDYQWQKGDSESAFLTGYRNLTGHLLSECETIDDVFRPKFTSALQSFFGRKETARIREECAIIMEFPYSHSLYRPSYRSRMAGDYQDTFFTTIVNALKFICYDMSTEQALVAESKAIPFSSGSWEYSQYVRTHPSSETRIAIELRRGNEKIFKLIEEAILGDNSEILMSHSIISGIVKSGHPRALELLGKLLLAAKGQEGLRQAIVENCDCGTIDSHAYFIRLILENDLCRFSSVIRAFDTWSGLAYGDQKQKVAEKCMSLAQKYLSDENAIREALYSNDAIEIYLVLWAICCRDIHNATGSACSLLGNSEKYKRLVGWYFITHTNGDAFRHSIAVNYLDVRDPEELAWVCSNLHMTRGIGYSGYGWDEKKEKESKKKTYFDEVYPENKNARVALFEKLAEIAEFIGKKEKKFEGSVFPWFTQILSNSQPCGAMLSLAAYDRSEDLIRRLEGFLPIMNADQRLSYYSLLLNPELMGQRATLLGGLSDKSQTVRERVVARLQYYPLDKTDLKTLAEALTTRSADLRKGIIVLFDKQREQLIRPVIDLLMNSKDKNQLIAGVELLEIFSKKNPTLKEEYKDKISALSSDENLSQDVSILVEKIAPASNKEMFTAENGYGLYDPSSADFDSENFARKRPQLPNMGDGELKSLIVPDEKELTNLYDRFIEVFIRNKDYEYDVDNWDGSISKVLLFNDNYGRIQKLAGKGDTKSRFHEGVITDYPLPDEWLAAAGEYAVDKTKLAASLSLFCLSTRNYKKYLKWFKNIFSGFPIDTENEKYLQKYYEYANKKGVNVRRINQLLAAILNSDESSIFDFALSAYVNLVRKIPEDKLGIECETEDNNPNRWYPGKDVTGGPLSSEYLNYWRELARKNIRTQPQFVAYFNEIWYEYLASGKKRLYGLENEDIFRAHQLELISDDVVFYYFTSEINAPENMRKITGPYNNGREVLEKYPMAQGLLDNAINRIVTIEENRGELPTALTAVAAKINRFDGGVLHFVNLLAALGSLGFHRGYTYYYSNQGGLTKKESLSRLLRCCQPRDGESPEIFKAALDQSKINSKRAIQSALYAPQWAGLLEKATDIPGLKCGVWFFHAHINENFSAEKETEVAIYSAITPQQFNDGTFDKDWFIEAYNTLGEKWFNELYKNAKYITDSGSTHRRSQLYTDAVLGRFDKAELKAEIIEKRNQEKLRAFALIPLDDQNKNDALERYEFIQTFKKESRQFGSQRQASEGKACEIALDNLAITTGYGDADRMTWALEGAKIEQLRPMMEAHAIGDTEVWLSIEDDGTPSINVTKNGKSLKNVPKDLGKNPYIIDLKEAVKQLRDQKKRARNSFEMAMVSRTKFSTIEIIGLLNHPVLHATVSSLVFTTEDNLGFPAIENDKLALKRTDDVNTIIDENAQLIIAHPNDFIEHSCWSDFQQYLYLNKIVQPFKQVFREYYPITEDELAAQKLSRRYAGNQVQPKKTVELLKTRGWTVDYEEGLQRVWHKDNLIVRMYALADWFSPADIEAPTLEEIQFYSRDKGEAVSFSDIPPVIFSETMRDIDLVVSVAHVGGVDPETSQSTVEMRIAIARELLSLLSVGNVKFQTAHAQIAGSMGEYSVHMGSGVVHKSGTGMIAVLPVHSQARGRIFLPFADDDPKTAEILSKVLLFADDKKIKDPSILRQIK